MHEQSPTRLQGSALNSAISNAVVRIQRDHLGHGPMSARTHVNENTLIVELQETPTKPERTLAEQGEGEHVMTTRHTFQEAMQSDLAGAVEDLTGREAIAFMSATTSTRSTRPRSSSSGRSTPVPRPEPVGPGS